MKKNQRIVTILLLVATLLAGLIQPAPAKAQDAVDLPVPIDPAKWQDAETLFPEHLRESSTPAVTYAPHNPVPNAAAQPGMGAMGRGAEATTVKACYWTNLMDDDPAPAGYSLIQGDAYAGKYFYRLQTQWATFIAPNRWPVDPAAVERWVVFRYRGSPGDSPDNYINVRAVQYATPLRWGDLRDYWQEYAYQLHPSDVLEDIFLTINPTWSWGGRFEMDQVGAIYCLPPDNIDEAIPTVTPVTEDLNPYTQLIPVLGASIFYRVDSAWPLVSQNGFASIKYLMDTGCGGECFSSRFLPGTSPYARELKDLYGYTGPWVSNTIEWVQSYGQDFVHRRGFDPAVAQAAIDDWTIKLRNPSLGALKRAFYEGQIAFTRSKLDLWWGRVVPQGLERWVNSKVIYGLEIRASELSEGLRGNTEWYVKSGQLDPSRIRLLAFDAEEADDWITTVYRQVLRRGAPLSALRVLKGDVDITMRIWWLMAKGQAGDQWGNLVRVVTPVLGGGSGVMGARIISGVGRGAAALGEFGAIVAVEAAAATFIVGSVDYAVKAWDYSRLDGWESSLTWQEYTCVNHGFSRISIQYEYGAWCEDATYVESRVRENRYQPVLFKIPAHTIATRRYVDGKQIFLQHPEVLSAMDFKVLQVHEEGLLLEKLLSNGQTTQIHLLWDQNGEALYTLLYDHPEAGLLTMTFEIVLNRHEDNGDYVIGVSYFETATPTDYGACPGWSPSRPENAPCFLGAYPANDYGLWFDVDRDGVATRFEGADPNGDGDPSDARDTDGDGVPNYKDDDDDGDGWPTRSEGADPNGDGDPSDAAGESVNGYFVPNYLNREVPLRYLTEKAYLPVVSGR